MGSGFSYLLIGLPMPYIILCIPKTKDVSLFLVLYKEQANIFRFWNAGETSVCSQSVGKHLFVCMFYIRLNPRKGPGQMVSCLR